MPFDGNTKTYEDSTIPDLSVQALAAWLRTRDPTEKYTYTCSDGRCLVGQFLIGAGVDLHSNGPVTYSVRGGPYYISLPDGLNDIAIGAKLFGGLAPLDRTFGAALARAEVYLARAVRPI